MCLASPRTTTWVPAVGGHVVLSWKRWRWVVGRVVHVGDGGSVRVEDFAESCWTIDLDQIGQTVTVRDADGSDERRYRIGVLRQRVAAQRRALEHEIDDTHPVTVDVITSADPDVIAVTTPLGVRHWRRRNQPTTADLASWRRRSEQIVAIDGELDKLTMTIPRLEPGDRLPHRVECEALDELAGWNLVSSVERTAIARIIEFWDAHPDVSYCHVQADGTLVASTHH